jgi:release factor glutamine methyltransferase
MTERIWTVKEIIDWSTHYLKKAASDTPRLDAELLLTKALNCRRLDLYLDHHKPLIASEKDAYRDLIRRRAAGEPVAYILGQRDFYGLSFQVNRHTLIPRPETETLVEQVLAQYPLGQSVRGLDVGTGSGCIAITLKKLRPDWAILAWDLSPEALALARSNGEKLEADVIWEERDALLSQNWRELGAELDFVVANPPYIGEREKPDLSPSVTAFEPNLALFAPDDGLLFYKTLASEACSVLRPEGKIFLEIGHKQAPEVSLILEDRGWQGILVHRDLAGRDRVVTAILPP